MTIDNRTVARKDDVISAPALASASLAPDDLSTALSCKNVTVDYGDKRALKPCTIEFYAHRVTALIGPSGCGKSTFLRCLNQMNREVPHCRMGGQIWYHEQDINAQDCDLYELRRGIGMVFQQPNPFPLSIYDNVAYGPRRHGRLKRVELDAIVEEALTRVGLWDEVKDSLKKSGLALSGGQQQRLCIARTLAVNPEILLMDEPTSALDPISTALIERLMSDLAQDHTVIIVTHNMQQATRISDYTAFFYVGELIEYDQTSDIFNNPCEKRTQDYIAGRFS